NIYIYTFYRMLRKLLRTLTLPPSLQSFCISHESFSIIEFIGHVFCQSEIRLNHISTAFFMLYEINNNKKIYYILTLTLNLYVSTSPTDRKSTRLNSSHSQISYAVFCL